MNIRQNFNQQSDSIQVNDRFYESQSQQVIEQESQAVYHMEQPRSGISEMLNFSQISQKKYINQMVQEDKQFYDREELQEKQRGNPNQIFFSQQRKLLNQKKKESRSLKNPLIMEKKKQNSKNYRQRKKQYFQKLQEQLNFYKKKSLQLQEKNKQLYSVIQQLKYNRSSYERTGYEAQYFKDVKYMKNKIDQGILSNQQLLEIAAIMRQKYGPAGEDRKRIQNYYMSQYMNQTMADFQKYLLIASLKRTGPFGEIKSKLDQKLIQITNLTQNQQQKLRGFSNELHDSAVSFIQSQILDEARKCHYTMKKGYQYFVVPQLAKFVFWFEQNRNIIQIRKLRQQWLRIITGEMDWK